MSLVAAVAVAGLTTANAGSLEDAIKNIDVSGAARLRLQSSNIATGTNDYSKDGYTVDIATKVSDDTTVTVSFGAKDVNSGDNATVAAGAVGFTGFNVTYTGVANTTAIIGKQALGTPFTVASDLTGLDQSGNGILVVNSSTPVTLIGGYMDALDVAGYADLAIFAATANVAGLGLEAWYANTGVVAAGDLVTQFYKASYALTVEDIKLGASVQYASGKITGAAKNAITRYELKAAMGMFDGGIKYATVNKNGQTVAFDNTAAAKNGGMEGLIASAGTAMADGSSAMYYVNAKVLPTVKVGAWYLTAERSTTIDDSETIGYASWSMAKGTSLTAYAGNADINNQSESVTRLQLDYKF